MSTTINTTTETTAHLTDNETAEAEIRYSFKTTDENKTKSISISLSEEVKENIVEYAMRNARWRSVSQFVTDALVFYLNQSGTQSKNVKQIIADSEWSSEHRIGASITDTLFREIEILVSHGHTPWYSKQVFYICALRAYNEAGFPAVEQR